MYRLDYLNPYNGLRRERREREREREEKRGEVREQDC